MNIITVAEDFLKNVGKSAMHSQQYVKIYNKYTKNADIFIEKPVSTREFFKEFYPEPFFPRQQKFVDALLGLDPFVWDKKYNEFIVYWGMGCVAKDTIIEDALSGEKKSIKEWADLRIRPFVKSINGAIVKADVPYFKGKSDLYEVVTQSGRKVKVSLEHKFYTADGWKELRELKVGDEIGIQS